MVDGKYQGVVSIQLRAGQTHQGKVSSNQNEITRHFLQGLLAEDLVNTKTYSQDSKISRESPQKRITRTLEQ